MELSTYIQHGYIQTLQCEKSEMQKNALSDTIYTHFNGISAFLSEKFHFPP